MIASKSSLTLNEFSADQWFFTKVLKQIVVNDVQHQWTKAGRYIRTRSFECGVSFDQDCKKETTIFQTVFAEHTWLLQYLLVP